MSNQAVGPLYQTIIEEVIASSRVDFEENGIEENVLEELRQVSHTCFFHPLGGQPGRLRHVATMNDGHKYHFGPCSSVVNYRRCDAYVSLKVALD